jgi:hypothetical protein
MDDRDGLFSPMASCGQGIVRRETRKHGHHVGCDIELFPGEFILFCCVYAFHDFSGDVTSPSITRVDGLCNFGIQGGHGPQASNHDPIRTTRIRQKRLPVFPASPEVRVHGILTQHPRTMDWGCSALNQRYEKTILMVTHYAHAARYVRIGCESLSRR